MNQWNEHVINISIQDFDWFEGKWDNTTVHEIEVVWKQLMAGTQNSVPPFSYVALNAHPGYQEQPLTGDGTTDLQTTVVSISAGSGFRYITVSWADADVSAAIERVTVRGTGANPFTT